MSTAKVSDLLRGIATALGIVALQVLLVQLPGEIPAGTRAQAVGACLATLAMVAGGVLMGLRNPRSWQAGLVASVLVAMLGSLGAMRLDLASAAGAIASTDRILLPCLVLTTLGATISKHATGRWWLSAPLAFLLLAGLEVGSGLFAVRASFDPDVINVWVGALTIVSLIATGVGLAVATKRLALGELALVALANGYALYLVAATFGKDLLAASDIPQEQILVALAFAPAVLSLALLAVGSSIGFLLMGSGHFDAGFSFEAGIARRYLASHARLRDVAFRFLLLPISIVRGLVSLWCAATSHVVPRSSKSVGTILIISVAGVALGVMALVVVLSVMSGFEGDLKTKILGAHAHVVVGKHGDDFTEYDEIEKRLGSMDATMSAAAFVLGEGMMSSDGGLSGVLVKGIDPQNERAVAYLRTTMTSGALEYLDTPNKVPLIRSSIRLTDTASGAPALTAPKEFDEPNLKLPAIVIGKELARTLRVRVGQTVNVVSPMSEEIGPTGPEPKLRRFLVAGIFFSGMYEYDSKFAYVHIREAQRFFGLRKKATGVELRVKDVDETTLLVEEIKRRIGGYPYTVKDWREMNKELFSALLLEKLAMFIILTFIVLVASFNIVSTLVMIVLEKGREIAILKSMGANDASIMKIFVVQGLIVGVGGALLGLFSGVTICLLIERFGLPLDASVFYIDRLPVVMDWREIVAIGVAAVLITYLATIYPAIAAAQLKPVEGLRDE